jgi:gamma-glutamylcyclotransferase (GGCT)/AIG2-like uncharacterized protein YtfP
MALLRQNGAIMNLFVYGSLMLPEVMQAVAGQKFPFQGGMVRGYAQFELRDEHQAAMIPFPDTSTEGVVYADVDESALKRLDAFAGAGFDRVEVNVEAENGEWIEAEAHVLRMRHKKRLMAEPWDEDEFRQKHLAGFLKVHSEAKADQKPAGRRKGRS